MQQNVGYDSLGHCFFLEDGLEMGNVFDGNLGFSTRAGSILPTDRDATTCRNVTSYSHKLFFFELLVELTSMEEISVPIFALVAAHFISPILETIS